MKKITLPPVPKYRSEGPPKSDSNLRPRGSNDLLPLDGAPEDPLKRPQLTQDGPSIQGAAPNLNIISQLYSKKARTQIETPAQAGPNFMASVSWLKKNMYEYDPAKPNDYNMVFQDKKIKSEIEAKIHEIEERIEKEKTKENSTIFLSRPTGEKSPIKRQSQGTGQGIFNGEGTGFGGGSWNKGGGLGEMELRPSFGSRSKGKNQEKDQDVWMVSEAGESQEEKMYKLMERSGWKRGSGLGKNEQGMITPLITKKRLASKTSIIMNDTTVDKETLAAITEKYRLGFALAFISPVLCYFVLIQFHQCGHDGKPVLFLFFEWIRAIESLFFLFNWSGLFLPFSFLILGRLG